MSTELHVGVRYGPDREDIVVDYNAAGDVTVTLSGEDMTTDTVAATVQTALQTVEGSFTCTEADGVFTIAHSARTFDITWSHATLRDLMGFSGASTGIVASVTGTAAPIWFQSSHPWYGHEPIVMWSLKQHRASRQRILTKRLGFVEGHRLIARLVTADDRAAFRTVAAYLLEGHPCSILLDGSTTAAWTYTLFHTGRIEAVLAPWIREYVERYLAERHLAEMEIPLEFVEYAA